MSQSDAERRLALEIRNRKLQIRSMRRGNEDPDAILVVIAEMEELTDKYNRMADSVYIEKIDDIANDFCDEFYYELGKEIRDEVLLSKFYDLDAVLTVIGNDKYTGKLAIIKSILDKFRDLRVEQTIERITVDRSQSRHAAIHFDCESLIRINEDKPRKVLQMLEIVKSTLPSTYPYVIKREVFLVKDARPLYHWPEKPLVPTKHDNWEPQFRPKVVERPKSATPAVVAAAEPADAQSGEAEDEDGGDGEEGEGEGEDDEDSVRLGNGEEGIPAQAEQATEGDHAAAEGENGDAHYEDTGEYYYAQEGEPQYDTGEHAEEIGVLPDS